MDCVADFWDRFTPEQQQLLNALAKRNEERTVCSSGHSVGFDPFDI
jgi:hypothetical protein